MSERMRAGLDEDEIQLLANLVRAFLVGVRDGTRRVQEETLHHTVVVEVVEDAVHVVIYPR